MATIVITNASVVINSVDLSDHNKMVKLTISADMLEDTAMGATYHTSKAGLKKFAADMEFYQDFASAKTDLTLRPLVGAAAFPLVIKGDSAAGTNNTFTMANVVVEGDYNPLNAGVGVLDTVTIRCVPGSGFSLTVS